jgi:hypothetical protein
MVMLHNLFLILFASLSALQLEASITAISGEAPGMSGRELYLLRTTDFLSNNWEKVESATIDENDAFSFRVEIDKTGHYELRTGSWSAQLFLKPDAQYELLLEGGNGSKPKNFDQNQFDVTFLKIPSNDPNIVIAQFNQAYERLFGDLNFTLAQRFNRGSAQYKKANEEALLHANIISESDSVFRTNPEADSTEVMFNQFVLGVQTWQMGIDDDFSKRLLNSALGRLDLHLGQKQLKVWETYLVDSLIYPGNPEWMGLFLEVHSGVSSNPYVSKKEVIAALKTGDFNALKTSLDLYPLTRTSSEKQLLMVLLAKEGWYQGASFRRGVLKILDSYEQLSIKNELVKKCAKNMRFELTKGTPYNEEGLPFGITLLDHKDDRFELTELKGELIYVGFFQSQSPSSQRELMVLENTFRKYGRQIKFVMICMDEVPGELSSYLSDHKDQEWLILKGGGDPFIRNHMNLKSVPQFFFISPDGKLMEPYTLKPSEGIASRMASMLRGPRPEKIKVWDD